LLRFGSRDVVVGLRLCGGELQAADVELRERLAGADVLADRDDCAR